MPLPVRFSRDEVQLTLGLMSAKRIEVSFIGAALQQQRQGSPRFRRRALDTNRSRRQRDRSEESISERAA